MAAVRRQTRFAARAHGFALYLGSRLLEQATLLQQVTIRLADLD
jgi:hypothetical protein